ncbi:hypothetical protein COCOBI_07-1190 [Coccomyxa sp. Obi]|nr:hypothetical protein COCOBI_07-1190 [Coccomyxa sp. Obi]
MARAVLNVELEGGMYADPQHTDGWSSTIRGGKYAGASMRRCHCFFLVLVLAAASAGSLVASQKAVSEEEHVLQTQSSAASLGLKRLPDEKPEDAQLPVRRAGAAAHRRGARLRLRRKRRAEREAKIGNKDPGNASEGVGGASGEPGLKRNDAGNDDSKTGSGTGREQGEMTLQTSIMAAQSQNADSLLLKDDGGSDSEPISTTDSATTSSAKGAAEQEVKPSLVDQMRPGDLGGSQKSTEPLPHDGWTQVGSDDPGDPDKEHSYPALDTPDDDPYDLSKFGATVGRNRASDLEAGDGVQAASKDAGDKAAGGHGGKNPRQQSGDSESQAALDGEQSSDGARSSSEAGDIPDSAPGKKPAAGGRGDAGAKEDARFGKVSGGGSKAGSAKCGSGAKSDGGGSKGSDAKIGSGGWTGGGAGADMASSDKEPAENLKGLHDAIALLQKGDVGDGVFELGANEDEEDDGETVEGGMTKGAAGKTKDRKDKKFQNQDNLAGSAKTAGQNSKARASRNEQSSADRADQKGKSGADRNEQRDASSAEQQKKAGASKSEGSTAESTNRKEEAEIDTADQSRASDSDGQPEQATGQKDRSAPRTFDRLLDHYKVASFLDVPCGDGDQVSNKVDHFPTSHPSDIRYIGVDDSEAAIESAESVHGDTPNWSFQVQDYVHRSLPNADLLVSRAALLRPDMLTLVDMLENFALSGAKYLLLGSFEKLTFTVPSISTESDNSKESDQDEVESVVITYSVSLQQEPFSLDSPLQVFSEPEGFGAKFGTAAISGKTAVGGTAAKTGESAKADIVDKSDGDAKTEKNAKGGVEAKAGDGVSSEKDAASLDDAESGVANRQMLLYTGDYLRQQDFSDMRDRAELFLFGL